MNRYHQDVRRQESEEKAPTEAWLFAQAVLGKPIPKILSPEARARAKREELERLAQFYSHHAEELRRLQRAEAEARREREVLEFAAKISDRAAAKLTAIVREETKQREAWRRAEQYAARLLEGQAAELRERRSYQTNSVPITEWNPSQPRQPKGTPEGGQWAPKDGGGIAQSAAASSDWYLPSDDKGTWLGKKGESTFRLKTPVEVNGKLVHDIDYHRGVPVLDKFALPGKTATIVLTGDRETDIRHAKEAWKKLNPGRKLPENSTFHHDLLHATEHIEMVDGKKTKVLVGKMQLVPQDVHKTVYHQGTASVATRYYEGLGSETKDAIKRLSKQQASLAGTGKDFVARAAKKIKPGKIAKGLAPLVGRTVLRAIPLIGTGLAVLEFADNVEAHGLGGAIARATPVLGDLISAHDLGTDLAKEIVDDANAKADAHLKALNGPVNQAREEANQQTLDAFKDLAPQIQVTNSPEYGTGILVDPHEIADALNVYRNRMMNANQLRIVKQKGFDYKAAAARNKEELRRELERASQKRSTTTKSGPLM